MASKTQSTKPTRAARAAAARKPKAPAAVKRVPRSAAAQRKRPVKAPQVVTTPPAHASKQGLLLGLLRSAAGATVDQMAEATGWQRHTVRGTISGVLRKKLKLNVVTEKADGGAIYRIVESSPDA